MTAAEFKKLRMECGWSQYLLADLLGVTRSSVTHWECGRAPVPTGVRKALRDAHAIVTAAMRILSQMDT